MPVNRLVLAAMVCLSACGRGAQTKDAQTTNAGSTATVAESVQAVVPPPEPSTQPAPQTAVKAPPKAPSKSASAQITLERTACFGACPVYRVVLTDDGTVVFEGKQNVDSVGRFTGRVSRDKVAALVRLFEQKNYFAFADRYAYDVASCRPYISDLPSAITSITLDGRAKRVDHDPGCPRVPADLAEIEKSIDETAATSRWIGQRS